LKGIYTVWVLVPTLLASVGDMGIGMANVYHLGRKRYPLREIVWNSIIIALVVGPLLSLIGGAFLLVGKEGFGQLTWLRVLLALTALPLLLLTSYLSMILLGLERSKEYNCINIFSAVSWTLAAFFLLIPLRTSLNGALVAWYVSACLTPALLIFALSSSGFSVPHFEYRLLKDSLRFGIQGHVSNILTLLSYRLDIFLLAYLSDPISVGHYSVAVTLAETIWLLPNSVSLVLLPRVSSMDESLSKRLTAMVCRNTLLAVMATAIVAFALARPMIRILFGMDFSPATGPYTLLLPGMVVLSVSKILSSDLIGRGKPIIGTYAAGATLLTNLPLNLWLIPRFDARGAAIASSVSYCLSALILLFAFSKISGSRIRDIILVSHSDLLLYRDYIRSFYARFAGHRSTDS